ncbi:MAG: hypothetical protein V1743_02565 [Nanoarchaeota archaeon]
MKLETLLKTAIFIEFFLVTSTLFLEYNSNIPGLFEFFGFLTLLASIFLYACLVKTKMWKGPEWFLFALFMLNMVFVIDKLVANLFGMIIDLCYLFLNLSTVLWFNSARIANAVQDVKKAKAAAFIAKKKEQPAEKPSIPSLQIYTARPRAQFIYRPAPAGIRKFEPSRLSELRRLFIEKNFSTKKQVTPEKQITPEMSVPQVMAPAEDGMQTTTVEFQEAPAEAFEPVQEIEPEPPKPKETYIASENGEKYHLKTCMIALRIPKAKRMFYDGRFSAEAEGLLACKICNPKKAA